MTSLHLIVLRTIILSFFFLLTLLEASCLCFDLPTIFVSFRFVLFLLACLLSNKHFKSHHIIIPTNKYFILQYNFQSTTMCFLTVLTPNQVPLQVGKKRPLSVLQQAPKTKTITTSSNSFETKIRTLPSSSRRNRVYFSETTNIIGRSNTYQDDIERSWYLNDELAVFKLQARDHALGRGHKWVDQETRGYERYNAARSSKKTMTRKVTLLACSQKGLSQDDVAKIITRSSSWAVKDAFLMGFQDYCEVYCPQMDKSLCRLSTHDTTTTTRNEH